MTDDEMRSAIAKALGWTSHDSPLGTLWREPDIPSHLESRAILPNWTHSLDACARDLLPVARERGWWPQYDFAPDYNPDSPEEWGFFPTSGEETVLAYAPTGEIARALCEAWLAGPGKDGAK